MAVAVEGCLPAKRRNRPPLLSNSGDPALAHGLSFIFNSSACVAQNFSLASLTSHTKIAKMAEADDYLLNANKAMMRGIFLKSYQISSSNIV